jgi:hypothetical protein
MRVESKLTTVYFFTKDEMWSLINMDIWKYINERLKSNERIEIE